MTTIILFIIILSILVFVHEFGHFYTAKKSGMKVYEFAIGFPPRAIGVYKDPRTKKWIWIKGKGKSNLKKTVAGEEQQEEYPSTIYSINWLPLGGFVRIKGENGEQSADSDSFGYQAVWKKLLVLVAGVTMNFVLAAILLGIGFMIGLPTDVSRGFSDKQAQMIGQPKVLVQQVEADSPAKEAGLLLGDEIMRINGVHMTSVQDVIDTIQTHGEQELAIDIKRKEETLSYVVTPKIQMEGETARIGTVLADAAIIRYPWYLALWKGLSAATIGVINILLAFFFLIKGLILGQGMAFGVSGPVGIASIIGQSARLGITHLINVTAMISLSLAVINILPIPALDGGRMLFIILGKIIRKPVPLKYEQIAHTLGFVFLMILIVIVTVRDVLGLF